MARIFLSIGSNIEPEKNLLLCASALAYHFESPVWSPIYRSAAVGMEGDDFLNSVVMASTDQTIEIIVRTLKQIEANQGRVREVNKFSSRTLDIDLLLHDKTVLQTPDITIPREEITTAAHVLKPLADLIPNDIHPVANKTYAQLLSEFSERNSGSIEQLHQVAEDTKALENQYRQQLANNE